MNPLGAKPVAASDRPVAAAAKAARAPGAATVAGQRDEATARSALAALAREQAAAPPIDYERIARIRNAIADGDFPIFPATVADRLIALKLEWNPHDAA